MKKGTSKAILCCLGLALFAGTGCMTVQQDARPAKPEVKVADATYTPAPAADASGKAAATPAPGAPKDKAVNAPPPAEVVRRVPTKYNVSQYMPDTSKTLGTEVLLSEMSKEVAGKVFYEMQEEGEKNFTAKIAVVNAVPLSDLKRDTEFGRVMGEYLLTDLADRGLKVTELRLGKDITILPQTGEFILSQNIGELANKTPELEYVVVTTFANTRKTLIVQGRLVRLADGAVKTSWRYSMPLNRELLGLFQPAEAPYKIAVKGVGR
jgi:TolB-like protein